MSAIHWAGLARVAEVGLAFGVGIAIVFALGVVGLSRLEDARETGDGSVAAKAGGYALAGSAFALCGAAVLFGLYLIIPQFHR
jgi:cyanate permease